MIGLVFLLPAIVVYLIFAVVPFFDNLILSFQEWNGFSARSFVGIRNYIDAFEDDIFRTAIKNSVFLGIFERLFPNQQSLTGDPFLDMIGYVFVVSLGMAILFNLNASSGGLDIIAKFLNKYLHIDLGQAISAAGICAALSSALVYDSKIVFLSLLGTYLNGLILDHFILGFHARKRVCIISSPFCCGKCTAARPFTNPKAPMTGRNGRRSSRSWTGRATQSSSTGCTASIRRPL